MGDIAQMTSLENAVNEWVDLFVIDVEDFPHMYKREITAQPSLWAIRIAAGLSEPEVRTMIRHLKAERGRAAPRTGGNTL